MSVECALLSTLPVSSALASPSQVLTELRMPFCTPLSLSDFQKLLTLAEPNKQP